MTMNDDEPIFDDLIKQIGNESLLIAKNSKAFSDCPQNPISSFFGVGGGVTTTTTTTSSTPPMKSQILWHNKAADAGGSLIKLNAV